ncbi:MAG TPA: hypothetical protein DEA95_00205 [Nitrospiraceae bacterium]|nr:hypothetical protein [Nitrospiraceae bacterium]
MLNTAILSIGIGKRINLPRNQLSRLGMAAVLHDIGKAEIPMSILNKPSELDSNDLELMMRHPVDGVRMLMRTKDLSDITVISMLASLEHHINYDRSGYPELPNKRIPNIFSRIVSIADCYDALTSGKVYKRTAYSPENTLRFIHDKSGKLFDPVLARVFIKMLAGNNSTE